MHSTAPYPCIVYIETVFFLKFPPNATNHYFFILFYLLIRVDLSPLYAIAWFYFTVFTNEYWIPCISSLMNIFFNSISFKTPHLPNTFPTPLHLALQRNANQENFINSQNLLGCYANLTSLIKKGSSLPFHCQDKFSYFCLEFYLFWLK